MMGLNEFIQRYPCANKKYFRAVCYRKITQELPGSNHIHNSPNWNRKSQ